MANEVKWIKITTDIFEPNGKLFAIESLPDGYMLEIVWFKLLVLTGKLNNNGFVVNSAKIPFTDEMLSQAFRIDLGTIQRALEIFQRYEMVEVVDNAYMISNWLEHQHGDRLDEIKGKNRERQQRYRDKQKALSDRNVTNNVTNNVNCSISISNSLSESNSLVINNIVSYLNNKLNTNYKSNSKNTVKHIKARLAEGFTEEDFYRVIDIKVAKWGNDPKMAQYLRPDTLFGTKFESYLNEKQVDNKKSSTESFLDKWANA